MRTTTIYTNDSTDNIVCWFIEDGYTNDEIRRLGYMYTDADIDSLRAIVSEKQGQIF